MFFSIVSCGSLHIEKRIFRKGYHVSWNKKIRSKVNNSNSSEKTAEQSQKSQEQQNERNKSAKLENRVLEVKQENKSQLKTPINTLNDKINETNHTLIVKTTIEDDPRENGGETKEKSKLNKREKKAKEPPTTSIISLIGFLCFVPLGALILPMIPGLVLSIIAVRQIRKNHYKYKRHWLAYVPIILTIIGFIVFIPIQLTSNDIGVGFDLAIAAAGIISLTIFLISNYRNTLR